MLVSSFLFQRNGHTTHSAEKYIAQFNRMRSVNTSPMILFLDPKINTNLLALKNVSVIPCSIEDTDTFSILNSSPHADIQVSDNPTKNTKDFHIIMNAKTEFLHKASDITDSNYMAWVDFGIGHVINDDRSFLFLNNINKMDDGVYVPGCWNYYTNILNHPAWRFSGGFFMGDKHSLRRMHDLSTKVIHNLLPVITWEVNVWSIMEMDHSFPFKWYYGLHDDTILKHPFI